MSYSSLRQRIDLLPEPERSARRALYTDDEWLNSWELTAWDHQLPPRDEEWRVWTLVGPPQTGKTEAGLRWVQDHFFTTVPKRIAIVSGHYSTTDECIHRLLSVARTLGSAGQMSWDQSKGLSHPTFGKIEFHGEGGSCDYRSLQGSAYSYIWGDDIMDAENLIQRAPSASQYVFTQPTTLPRDTLLSRPKG